ncbi:MAG: trigger factor [Clostridia bacterium]|nr:trigger factor [Clostridia bacterium]
MSLKNVKNEEKNRVTLEIVIPKADFDAAVSKVFAKKSKSIVINGFRKGKAPRSVIEKIYGKGVFYEDALNDMLPEVLKSAVEESKAEIVSSPELEVGDINDEGVQLTAKYYVKPEVTVKEYKGLKAEKTVRTATDEEVDAEISRVRERNARTVDVTDRAAKDGDVADIDYEGSVDGKVFEGGSDKGHKLTLGSHSFIPGFEDQVIGHSVGDEFDVNVTFPEDYHAEELKGKAAVFKVKLNGIEFKELPELDDEFAKDVSEFDTLDEYKADVRAKINDRYSAAADNEVENKLIDALLENTEVDVPQCMFDEEADAVLRNYESNMAQSGISMEMYLKYTGMTPEKMKEQVMPQAQRQVKTRLALEKAAQLEKIEVTPEETDKEIASIAESYGMKPEEVKNMVAPSMVENDVKNKKILDFIKANAEITEKPYEAPKADEPAKKPAAKKPAAKKPAAKKPKAAPAEDKPAEEKAE